MIVNAYYSFYAVNLLLYCFLGICRYLTRYFLFLLGFQSITESVFLYSM
jgi:hypothetical protein